MCESCAFVLILNIIFGEDSTCPQVTSISANRFCCVKSSMCLPWLYVKANSFMCQTIPQKLFQSKYRFQMSSMSMQLEFSKKRYTLCRKKLLPYKDGWMLIFGQDAWLEGSTLRFERSLCKFQWWIGGLSSCPRNLWLQSDHTLDSFLNVLHIYIAYRGFVQVYPRPCWFVCPPKLRMVFSTKKRRDFHITTWVKLLTRFGISIISSQMRNIMGTPHLLYKYCLEVLNIDTNILVLSM